MAKSQWKCLSPGVWYHEGLGVYVTRQKLPDEIVWNIDLDDDYTPLVTVWGLSHAKQFVDALAMRAIDTRMNAVMQGLMWERRAS